MKTNSKGYIAISSVVIIMAVIIGLTLTMSYAAIGEGQSGLALYKGEENLNLVEGCVEDMMLKARSDASYNGGTLSRPEGVCVVTINSKTGSSPVIWNVSVTSQATEYKRTVTVVFNRSTTGITLTSWNEL